MKSFIYILARIVLGAQFIFAFWTKLTSYGAVKAKFENLQTWPDKLVNQGFGGAPGFREIFHNTGFDWAAPSLMPFGYALPWLELLIGLMLVLGAKTRTALIGMVLVYLSLTFGQSLSLVNGVTEGSVVHWDKLVYTPSYQAFMKSVMPLLVYLMGAIAMLLSIRHNRLEIWPDGGFIKVSDGPDIPEQE